MASLGFSVTATTTPQPLDKLIAATAGCTMTLLGLTVNIPPVQRAGQIIIQANPGMAGNLYIGGPNVSPTNNGGNIVAGQSYNLGNGSNTMLDLSNVWLLMSAGTGQANVSVAD